MAMSFLPLQNDAQTNVPDANGSNTPPVAQEKINTDIITLTRFLTEEQTKHKEATGDFTYIVPPHSLPWAVSNQY
jgi:hypothetical protein